MLRALTTAASGMKAQELNIDILANNLANVNTTGFKKARAEFQDLMYEKLQAPGTAGADDSQKPAGLDVGQGVRPVASFRNFASGEMLQTGNVLDLAIEGSGFFQLRSPNGEVAYTRDGSFRPDNQGRIVNAEGLQLDPAINVPIDATKISVARDGVVSAQRGAEPLAVEIGRIQLVTFTNPAGMEAMGRNLYRATDAAGVAQAGTPGQDGVGFLNQGFLEGSNVKVIEEMIGLIAAQRAYETNSKVIKAADEMLRTSTSMR